MNTHYLISHNKITWKKGVTSDALAITLLSLLDQNQRCIVNYSLKEGYAININGTFIKLLHA